MLNNVSGSCLNVYAENIDHPERATSLDDFRKYPGMLEEPNFR